MPTERQFVNQIRESLEKGTFVRLSFGNYRGGESDLKKLNVRKIIIKNKDMMGHTYSYKTRDIVKNFAMEESIEILSGLLGRDFGAGTLYTTEFDLVFDTPKGKSAVIRQNSPTYTESPDASHDRQKKRAISAGDPSKAYLHDLGITDAAGAVLKSSQDKFRQINRYIEILAPHLEKLPSQKTIRIVDMGSGKGYLTFALYDYVVNVMKKSAHVTGVEFRPDMVALCNKIARKSKFDHLDFVEGTIENFQSDGINVLIALHACDTATDDAIYRGIAAQADLIVVAPCCHKQIRQEMDREKKSNDLDDLTRHGIFMERQAEMVTDSLRALLLEYSGYATKVFEFISATHTPKNILIIGEKNSKLISGDKKIMAKIKSMKEFFGIRHHHLEDKIGA